MSDLKTDLNNLEDLVFANKIRRFSNKDKVEWAEKIFTHDIAHRHAGNVIFLMKELFKTRKEEE